MYCRACLPRFRQHLLLFTELKRSRYSRYFQHDGMYCRVCLPRSRQHLFAALQANYSVCVVRHSPIKPSPSALSASMPVLRPFGSRRSNPLLVNQDQATFLSYFQHDGMYCRVCLPRFRQHLLFAALQANYSVCVVRHSPIKPSPSALSTSMPVLRPFGSRRSNPLLVNQDQATFLSYFQGCGPPRPNGSAPPPSLQPSHILPILQEVILVPILSAP